MLDQLLLRPVEAHEVPVVGATGIVQRLMELAEALCARAHETVPGR